MKRIMVGVMVGILLAISMPALADHRGGGNWYYDHHEGWIGWWWVPAAGIWYYYPPAPIYLYPDPYVPPVTVINQQPPVIMPQANAPAQFWYYCESAKGYYPYVSSCLEAWRAVPVQPPQAAPR